MDYCADFCLDVLGKELGVVEVFVEAGWDLEEVVVGSLFDDLAFVHDDDFVGVYDGGEAVGDDY